MSFALVVAASAYSASSYVKRSDGVEHGYHGPAYIAQPALHHDDSYNNYDYAPLSSGYAPDYHKDYYAYPKYKFEYGVKDPHTGDHKTQWEVRDGDVVKGEYTLDEADGTKRVVQYTADDHNGFNAVVKNIGHAHHPQVYHHEPHHHQSYHHEEPYKHYGYANSYSNLYAHHH